MLSRIFKLVLIEDSAADVFLIERALSAAGLVYQLLAFEDGASAIDFVRSCTHEGRPDAFLLDLNVPKASGRQVLKALKSSALLSSVPTLVITSSPSPHERTEMERLGAVFITKPGNLSDFMRIGENVKAALASAAA